MEHWIATPPPPKEKIFLLCIYFLLETWQVTANQWVKLPLIPICSALFLMSPSLSSLLLSEFCFSVHCLLCSFSSVITDSLPQNFLIFLDYFAVFSLLHEVTTALKVWVSVTHWKTDNFLFPQRIWTANITIASFSLFLYFIHSSL